MFPSFKGKSFPENGSFTAASVFWGRLNILHDVCHVSDVLFPSFGEDGLDCHVDDHHRTGDAVRWEEEIHEGECQS